MAAYPVIKLLHILSATILFGTGLGIAYFMFSAYKSGDQAAFLSTAKRVVIADWIFTAPAVVVQLITGIWLTSMLGISFTSLWFVVVMALFVFIGVCWLPVVRIQIRISRALQSGDHRTVHRLMKIWTTLGALAFAAVLIIFFLMVIRPGLNVQIAG